MARCASKRHMAPTNAARGEELNVRRERRHLRKEWKAATRHARRRCDTQRELDKVGVWDFNVGICQGKSGHNNWDSCCESWNSLTARLSPIAPQRAFDCGKGLGTRKPAIMTICATPTSVNEQPAPLQASPANGQARCARDQCFARASVWAFAHPTRHGSLVLLSSSAGSWQGRLYPSRLPVDRTKRIKSSGRDLTFANSPLALLLASGQGLICQGLISQDGSGQNVECASKRGPSK